MSENLNSKKIASNSEEAQKRASELASKTTKTTQKRRKQDVATAEFDIERQEYMKDSEEFKKRASYFMRDYHIRIYEDDKKVVVNTKTQFSIEMCVAKNLINLVQFYLQNDKKNYIYSSKQILQVLKNRGACYGDNSRSAMQILAKEKIIEIFTKKEMIENNHAVDRSKFYYRLNMKNSVTREIVKKIEKELLQ